MNPQDMLIRISLDGLDITPTLLVEVFPARLRELAGSLILDHGVEHDLGSNAILFTFEVADFVLALEIVSNLITQERILGQDLRSVCRVVLNDAIGSGTA